MKQDLQALDFNLLKALNALLEQRSVTRAREQSLPAGDLLIHMLALQYCDNVRLTRMMQGMRSRWV